MAKSAVAFTVFLQPLLPDHLVNRVCRLLALHAGLRQALWTRLDLHDEVLLLLDVALPAQAPTFLGGLLVLDAVALLAGEAVEVLVLDDESPSLLLVACVAKLLGGLLHRFF